MKTVQLKFEYRTGRSHRHHGLSCGRSEHHWLGHRHGHDVTERLRCHWLRLLCDWLLGFGRRASQRHAHDVFEVVERWFRLRGNGWRGRASRWRGDWLSEVSHTHERISRGSLHKRFWHLILQKNVHSRYRIYILFPITRNRCLFKARFGLPCCLIFRHPLFKSLTLGFYLEFWPQKKKIYFQINFQIVEIVKYHGNPSTMTTSESSPAESVLSKTLEKLASDTKELFCCWGGKAGKPLLGCCCCCCGHIGAPVAGAAKMLPHLITMQYY